MEALPRWGLPGASLTLVATRENRIFRVEHAGARFALRLHRPGYRSETELRSELDWMSALKAGGLSVPDPVPALDGSLLQEVRDTRVDLLTWLDGLPLGATGDPLTLDDPAALFRAIGQELARLHAHSDAWSPPTGFRRWAWDLNGLVGETPVWGRFWDNPALDPDERLLFQQVRDTARRELAEHHSRLDYGLIHADLVRENILVNDRRVQFIDFDDGGFGYRLFDIAGALVKNLAEPNYGLLKDALIAGYRSERPLDSGPLDLLLLLRACTYLGWIIPRMNEPGAGRRNRRSIAVARQLAETYLYRQAPGPLPAFDTAIRESEPFDRS